MQRHLFYAHKLLREKILLMLAYDYGVIQNGSMSVEMHEIRGWFIPRVIPWGGAPEEIKSQWVNIPLPFRYDRPSEGPEPHLGHDIQEWSDITFLENAVSIRGIDAVKSLRIFERYEAADWWDGYFMGCYSDLAFAIEPEDQLLPHDYLRRILPGLEDFDRIEV